MKMPSKSVVRAGSIPAASTINLLNNNEFAQQQTVLNRPYPRSLWHDLGTIADERSIRCEGLTCTASTDPPNTSYTSENHVLGVAMHVIGLIAVACIGVAVWRAWSHRADVQDHDYRDEL